MLNFKLHTFPIFFFAVTYIHVAPVQWELKLKFYIEQKLIKNTLYNNTIIVLYLIFHEGFFFLVLWFSSLLKKLHFQIPIRPTQFGH